MAAWTSVRTPRSRLTERARGNLRAQVLDRRRATIHITGFVAASAILLALGSLDVARGSAGFWLWAAWGVVVALDAAQLAGRRLLSGSPEGHPPIPAGDGVVMTGSISSTVRLDYDADTAEKSYRATRLVRLLYRLSFQAPFPYEDNFAALEAARHRRTVAGLLTKFWFGENMVAQTLDVRREDGGAYTFVTELVRGTAPRDERRAKDTLRALTARFLQAGLPSWQVGHYNPRATGNLIERADGAYRIIDLESNLVTPFLPPAALVRAIRLGQYPSFDDIDVPRLRDYLAANRDEIVARLGEAESARLLDAVDAYAEAAAEWYAGEPRVAGRVLSFAFRLVDVPSWVRGARRVTAGSQQLADGFIRGGIDDWVAEGHLSEREGERLQAALDTPEVASVTANLGAHMAMSIPLRFPFGSLARFGWTLVARSKAEWGALRRRAPAKTARQVHTIPVALMGLVPGFGAGAYLLAKPLRTNRALAVIVFDRLMRKTPGRLYWRLHLSALTTWFARPASKIAAPRGVAALAGGVRSRIAAVKAQGGIVAAVLAVNASALAVATVLHNVYGASFALSEFGLINSMDALQLLAAGLLGILSFRLFWRRGARRAPADASAGIFLWGVTGVGLLGFAADDFLGLHERVGGWIAGNLDFIPLLTNNADDFITLGYGVIGLAVLALFRHELFAARASSALLVAGVAAAAVMLGTDAYGHGVVAVFEFPAQVTAVALLMLAHLARYRELRAAERPFEVREPSPPRLRAPAGALPLAVDGE